MIQDNKLQRPSEDEQKGVTGGGVIHDTTRLNRWIVTDDYGEVVVETIPGPNGTIRAQHLLYFENQEDAQRCAREHGYSDQVVEWP